MKCGRPSRVGPSDARAATSAHSPHSALKTRVTFTQIWVPATGSPRREHRGVPLAGTSGYPSLPGSLGHLRSSAGIWRRPDVGLTLIIHPLTRPARPVSPENKAIPTTLADGADPRLT